MAERVIREGAAREGKVAADIGPDDARCLLEAWLAGIGLDLRGRELIAYLQSDGFSHADLYRRARRIHDRRLRAAVDGGHAPRSPAATWPAPSTASSRRCVPAVPYAPSTAFLGAEKAKLRQPRGRAGRAGRADRRRDRLDARRHPHDRTDPRARRARLRGRRDRHRPRRRPAPAGGGRAGAALLRGDDARRPRPARPGRDPGRGRLRPRPRHRARPGRASPRRCSAAITGVPLLASYHTELAAYAGLRSGDGGARGDRPRRPRRLLRRSRRRPLAEPRGRRLAGRARRRRRPGSVAGSAASTSTASTRSRPTATPTRARSRSSTPAG